MFTAIIWSLHPVFMNVYKIVVDSFKKRNTLKSDKKNSAAIRISINCRHVKIKN